MVPDWFWTECVSVWWIFMLNRSVTAVWFHFFCFIHFIYLFNVWSKPILFGLRELHSCIQATTKIAIRSLFVVFDNVFFFCFAFECCDVFSYSCEINTAQVVLPRDFDLSDLANDELFLLSVLIPRATKNVKRQKIIVTKKCSDRFLLVDINLILAKHAILISRHNRKVFCWLKLSINECR